MDRSSAIRIAVALAAGLTTFLVLGAGEPDRGDEFIYGLVVGAIAYWALGYAVGRNRTPNG